MVSSADSSHRLGLGGRQVNTLEDFNRELEEKHLFGFWIAGSRPEVYEPRASYRACIWRWDDVYQSLIKAGELLSLEQTARRFIGFHTPSKLRTTHTLAMGVQLVNPGEVAEAHRHTMGAIRFVLQGGGAQTTVNGEPFPMSKGDLITTPSRTWHDHFNGSSDPIIWLDGTDLPMVKFFEIGFGEMYQQKQQPLLKPPNHAISQFGALRPQWVSVNSNQHPAYRYRWQETEKALGVLGENPADPFDGVVLRYVNPLTGGSTLPTLSCEIQMLRAGEQTRSHRHTSSVIYHSIRGSGLTFIENEPFEWEEGDTFTVPQWQWHRHTNRSSEAAILFSMNDKPVLDALGFYRCEPE
jgi:1-hydroxy-2-naphthoate dioxygenase